ncbi:DUF1616 domain-containing protein [Methanosphaera sp. WGK6]|uniref:DUF1616 domain-containing protein n=1 Tax=Methanosphaera sp. WGK6 TaxID=1561964 RepID=UPI00084BFCBC|nr:DUF1616 domain-containing protein [Methanosphaera sp. WGK6]OED30278.1 hypothetical protein NL43_03890 [Methanosphaera sp. WGK6]
MVNKSSRNMIILLILTLISLVIVAFNLVNDAYIIIALFAIDFMIVGIAATAIIYPGLSFKKLIRKFILIIIFGIIFSLISTVVMLNMLDVSVGNIVLTLSVISFILLLIAILRKRRIGNSDKISQKSSDKQGISKRDNIDNSGSEEKNTPIPRTIFAICVLCIASLIGMEVPPFSIIPLWFGLCVPFIVFIPGYYLINIVLPRKDEIEFYERVGIAVFTSLIITSLIGLIYVQLNHMLNMRHVSMVVVLFTLFIIVPWYIYRLRKIDVRDRFSSRKTNILLILITGIVIVCVIGSGVYSTTQTVDQGNTTFVIEGINKTVDENGYCNFTNGEVVNSTFTVTNNEHKAMNYTVKVEVHNDSVDNVLSEETFSLNDGESITRPVNMTMGLGQKDIQYVLYTGNNTPYIIRHLYANVSEEY